MADVFSKEKRSDVMSRVKSKNTKPEFIVRRFLHSQGFRYSLHDKNLPGKPDIKLTKYKTVILVNGCFWHGHNKECGYLMPKTNEAFWKNKIDNNVSRDKTNIELLEKLGWRVIVIWECQLKAKHREITFKEVINSLKSQ